MQNFLLYVPSKTEKKQRNPSSGHEDIRETVFEVHQAPFESDVYICM
jgi:hypothetical protein